MKVCPIAFLAQYRFDAAVAKEITWRMGINGRNLPLLALADSFTLELMNVVTS